MSSQLSSTVKNSNFIILLSQINRGQNVYSFPRKENFGGVITEEDLDTLTHFATDHHKVETCEPRLILYDQQNNGLEEEVDPPPYLPLQAKFAVQLLESPLQLPLQVLILLPLLIQLIVPVTMLEKKKKKLSVKKSHTE